MTQRYRILLRTCLTTWITDLGRHPVAYLPGISHQSVVNLLALDAAELEKNDLAHPVALGSLIQSGLAALAVPGKRPRYKATRLGRDYLDLLYVHGFLAQSVPAADSETCGELGLPYAELPMCQ